MSYASLDDILARYPAEATVLAADEETGVRDDTRLARALVDGAREIRAILTARYTAAELAGLDDDSRGVLALYEIDIALYRVALAYGRANERVRERYEVAIKRLEAIAAGKGALTFAGAAGAGTDAVPAAGGPAHPLVEAGERIFTRRRLRGW